MYKGKKIIAIIPARGGSKGLPRKNVRLLDGKPLIVWSIAQALQSKLVDRTIVSSEDAEIVKIAAEAGAEIPFVRPAHLAADGTPGVDVICHAVEALAEAYDYVVLLQPTSPLRQVVDIDAAVALCVDSKAPSVVSICEHHENPHWMFTLSEKKVLLPFLTDTPAENRQDLPTVFALNGAVFVLEVKTLLRERSILYKGTLGYEMPPERSFDIDTELDLKICEFLKRDAERSA